MDAARKLPAVADGVPSVETIPERHRCLPTSAPWANAPSMRRMKFHLDGSISKASRAISAANCPADAAGLLESTAIDSFSFVK